MTRRPTVLFGDAAAARLLHGFCQLGELLALTLGPAQGNILHQRAVGGPELLGTAADIARRVVALPGAAEDVGAMLMRNLAWRVHRRAGDGVATAAVLAMALLRAGQRYTLAGGDPLALRRGFEHASAAALAELRTLARPAHGEVLLTQVATTICGVPALGLVLGELFDLLGPLAQIDIEAYVAPYLERVYYDGGRWNARLESPFLINDPAGQRAVLDDCQVLVYAGSLASFAEIEPLLRLFDTLEPRRLLLAAHDVRGIALSTLVVNHQRGTLPAVVCALRRRADLRSSDMADLALLTGARLIDPAAGDSLARLTASDLGRVRRAEASADYLVVSGGAGLAATRRTTVETLLAQRAALPEGDTARDELELRLARLSGGMGVLQIGAYSQTEREQLQRQAERAVRAMRLAASEGLVPGGGVGLLQLIPAAEGCAAGLTGDEAVGARLLAQALEAPLRRIVANRGLSDPAVVLATLRRQGPGAVYDALADRVVPAEAAELFDPAGVLRVVIETAVSGAAMALTTSAIVLRRAPDVSSEP